MKAAVVIVVVLGIFLVAVTIAYGLGIGLVNHFDWIKTNIINRPPQKGLDVEKEEGSAQNNTTDHEKPDQGQDEEKMSQSVATCGLIHLMYLLLFQVDNNCNVFEENQVTKVENSTLSFPSIGGGHDAPCIPEKLKDERSSFQRFYKHAAVQSTVTKCSDIGVEIMKTRNGSAVDAAVATMFCMGVVNFPYSGVGGGHLMTIYQAPRGSDRKEARSIIARETLPNAGHRDFFKNNSALLGGTAVGVPGEVMGLYTAWQRFGRVPWHQLVAPSIKLAEDGFQVEKPLATAIHTMTQRNLLTDDFRETLMKGDGCLYSVGDIIRSPKLARTLHTIGTDPHTFYKGPLADDIVADIQEAGGVVTKDDLIGYRSRIKEPIKGRLTSLNLTMYSPPPPSSGVILQLILRLIDGFKFSKRSLNGTDTSVDTFHKLIESWKFAYAKRTTLTDEDFADIESLLSNLTDSTYIDEIRSKIDQRSTRDIQYYGPEFDNPRDAGTAHVNVLAPDGSAVSVTASQNILFGAQFVGRRTGIIFNNCMDDFSVPGTVNSYGFPASPANYPEPGKSPMSSMSPTIMLTDDGQVAYMSGAANGSIIISAISSVAFYHLYAKMDLDEATNSPRLHHQLMPNSLTVQPGFDQDIVDRLMEKGHQLEGDGLNGQVGTIRNHCSDSSYSDTCIEAVTDYRFGGQPPSGF